MSETDERDSAGILVQLQNNESTYYAQGFSSVPGIRALHCGAQKMTISDWFGEERMLIHSFSIDMNVE